MKDNEIKGMLKEPSPEELAKLKEDKGEDNILKPEPRKDGITIGIHKPPQKYYLIPDGKGGVTKIENPNYNQQMWAFQRPDDPITRPGEEARVDPE